MITTWLETIGNAVLHHLWQMALLYIAYQWLCVARVRTAAGRYRLALSLQLMGLLLLVANLALPAAWPVAYTAPAIGVSSNGLLQALYRAMGIAYALFTGCALLKQGLAWQQLTRLSALPAQKAPVQWRIFVQKHAEWLHIKKGVTLKLCARAVPATYGWLKPVILLPVACINGLSPRQVEAVLLHELAHIKRDDFFWNLVFQLSQIFLYFNPFCQMLQRHALSEAEKACDDWVIQFGYSPAEYSEALVKIARMENEIPAAFSLAATGSKSGLYLRIHRLLTGKEQQRPSWKMHLAAAALIALLWLPGQLPRQQPPATTPGTAGTLATLRQYYSRFAIPVSGRLAAKANLLAPVVDLPVHPGPTLPPAGVLVAASTVPRKPLTTAAATRAATQQQQAPQTETAAWLDAQPEQSAPLFLNTGNLETLKAASPELNQSKAMPAFEQLLNKLEANHCLEHEEWEELALLIEYYTELKKALITAYEKQQGYPEVTYAKAAAPRAKEILMIVYDENAGTLAASSVSVRLLPVVIQEDLAGNPDKQVVLLKKKAPKKKAVDL